MKEKVSDQAQVIALLDFVRDGGAFPKLGLGGPLAFLTKQLPAEEDAECQSGGGDLLPKDFRETLRRDLRPMLDVLRSPYPDLEMHARIPMFPDGSLNLPVEFARQRQRVNVLLSRLERLSAGYGLGARILKLRRE